jgi:hypothetical protein
VAAVAVGAALAGCVTLELPAMARVHVGHAATAWADTPGQRSLFDVALAEAAVAADATSLFAELRRPVALRWDQVPQFADIRMAGHEGGDFLFVRRRRTPGP